MSNLLLSSPYPDRADYHACVCSDDAAGPVLEMDPDWACAGCQEFAAASEVADRYRREFGYGWERETDPSDGDPE